MHARHTRTVVTLFVGFAAGITAALAFPASPPTPPEFGPPNALVSRSPGTLLTHGDVPVTDLSKDGVNVWKGPKPAAETDTVIRVTVPLGPHVWVATVAVPPAGP